MNTDDALRVFVEGFAFTRSVTHPYRVEVLGPGQWRLHDAPRRRASDTYRSEEFIVEGLAPAAVERLVRERAAGPFRVGYLLPEGEPDTALRAAFKALGYRLHATEALMAHDLQALPHVPEPYPISRVTSLAQADVVNQAMGRRTLLPEHLEGNPPPLRQYVAWETLETTPVGWVTSIAAAGCGWCSNLWVEPAFRRQGVARALLAQLLTDDKAAGAQANVLLASHTGAHLYPTVGYQRLGTLYVYTPPRTAG